MNKLLNLLMSVFLITMIYSGFAMAVHTSDASLTPEWSAAGQNEDYTVTVTNTGGAAINEFRIISNPDYDDFSCNNETGWILSPIQVYHDGILVDACLYVTNDDSIIENAFESFTFSAIVPVSGCNMIWNFETRDEETSSSGAWNSITGSTSVDDVEPLINITLGNPQVFQDNLTWITQSTPVVISVKDRGECGVSGLDYCEYKYDVDEVEELPWTIIDWTNITDDNYYNIFNYDEDSFHELSVRCYDIAGNLAIDYSNNKVDTTAPVTDFIPVGPYFEDENGNQWIDTVSTIELDTVDGGDICAIGTDNIKYANIPVDLSYCQSYDACYNNGANLFEDKVAILWENYNGSFSGGDEGCHIFPYYATDSIGNQEDFQWQCVFVDKSAPATWFGVNQPSEQCADDDPSGCNYWITDDSSVNLFCGDVGEHPSGNVTLKYRTWFDNDVSNSSDGWSDWDTANTYDPSNDNFEVMTRISFNEDSVHKVQYYCYDAVGKTNGTVEDPHEVVVRVDMTAPEITKQVIGPQEGQCPPDNETCYVTDETQVLVSVIDPDPSGNNCNIEGISCSYTVEWENQTVSNGSFNETGTTITFDEDSEHILSISCQDNLGNIVEDVETFAVDLEAPITSVTIGNPLYERIISLNNELTNDCYEYGKNSCLRSKYTTSDSEITLSAWDEKVGVDKTFYRTYVIEDSDGWNVCEQPEDYCNRDSYEQYLNGSDVWNEYSAPFTNDKESCHVIEYYSTDLFGHKELLNSECVFVDNSAPDTDLVVEEPSIEAETGTIDYYVNQETSLSILCNDVEPHPVRAENACFQVLWDNGTLTQDITNEYCEDKDDEGYCCVGSQDYTFNFAEDSMHRVNYYCKDGLGNLNPGASTSFAVDTISPVTSAMILDPYYIAQLCEGEGENETCVDNTYVDTATRVELTAVDPDPHPSGVEGTNYRISMVLNKYCMNPEEFCVASDSENWTSYNETFGFDQEGCTMVEYDSTDSLGNEENINTLCVFVDKSAPEIALSIEEGTPYYTDGNSSWITTETGFIPQVRDPQPNPSGVKEVSYRMTKVDDEACRNVDICEVTEGDGEFNEWTNESEGIYANEESCHLLEIYAEDNVGKHNTTKTCVFVDETGPITQKEVGVPNTQIMPEDFTWLHYPEVNGQCWQEDGIDCWDVTKLTPINLACEDLDPHPAGNKYTYFRVEVDGADRTELYCNANVYDGDYNVNGDGYCRTSSNVETFSFIGETSEHKLSYYCEDELGNIGNVDTEMFKVRETTFKIPLNFKQNLISVPVNLLDDSMDKVFEPVSDKVASVWQFDGQEWHIYTPDNDSSNDDITTMHPGWGYWVITKNMTTDEQIDLVIGGSLLDGVGTNYPSVDLVPGWNLIGYIGADGAESYTGPVRFDTPVGRTAQAACKLGTLKTMDGNLPVESMSTWWEPYNFDYDGSTYALVPMDKDADNMDPGAGYWMFYNGDEPKEYSWVSKCEPVSP